ncbi:hypothetical protein V6N13_040907 [Hibiscus sabdariffa]|uniref:Uncharacterized protein n=1 Tax=Hibiscus sabdariffa TaxID=183260 RepID=A0ABR2RA28_9ROSI
MADLKEISTKRKRLSLPVTRSLAGSFSGSKSQIQRSRNHYDLHHYVKKLKNSLPAEDSSTANGLSAVSTNSFDAAENQIAGIRLGGKHESFENGDLRKNVSNEDFLQSTPPDTEIFGAEPVVERNGTEFSDQFLEKKPCERNGMSYSMNSVLKPCSRARLFKTPGSFSYIRLVPYLMDIENDNSGPQIMGQCKKSEKGFEDKLLE